MTYEVVNVYPHDPAAFTQGLIFHDGYLYESTGLYGESSLRKVELGNDRNGLAAGGSAPAILWRRFDPWEDMLVQLTWQENTGFVYDREDFTLVDQFTYPTEGWGLTHDGHQLIMSDGTPLYFLDPGTWEVTGKV
jgi:glutaminyl-peptide cyclotransferase